MNNSLSIGYITESEEDDHNNTSTISIEEWDEVQDRLHNISHRLMRSNDKAMKLVQAEHE